MVAASACSASTAGPDGGTSVYSFACHCDCAGCLVADDAGVCTTRGRVEMDVAPCARDMNDAVEACATTCADTVGTDCVSTPGAQQSSIACDIPFDGNGIDR